MSKHSNQTKHFGNTGKIKKRSDLVISSNVNWLLNSGIRIKSGDDTGALCGWKHLNPPSYRLYTLKLQDMLLPATAGYILIWLARSASCR